MNVIKLIDKVKVSKDGPVSQSEESIHLMQGSMDGACGPYALMMILIILGEVERDNAIKLSEADGRTRLGKFRENLLLFGSLCKDGSDYSDLEWLSDCFSSSIKTEIYKGLNTRRLAATIKEYLDREEPLALSFSWQGGGAHWAVIVGYEEIDGQLTRLFILDPGYTSSKLSAWNAIIELFDESGSVVNKGRFSGFHWSENDYHPIKLDNCVAFIS